jgi:hypothetical protein
LTDPHSGSYRRQVNYITYMVATAIYEGFFAVALGGPAALLWLFVRELGAPPALVWTIGALAVVVFLSSLWLARIAAHCLAYQEELFFQAAMSAMRLARDELASLPLVGSVFAPRPQPSPPEE